MIQPGEKYFSTGLTSTNLWCRIRKTTWQLQQLFNRLLFEEVESRFLALASIVGTIYGQVHVWLGSLLPVGKEAGTRACQQTDPSSSFFYRQQNLDLLQLRQTVPGAADVLCLILVLVLLLPIEPLVAAIVGWWWGTNEHCCATKLGFCRRTHSMESGWIPSIVSPASYHTYPCPFLSLPTCTHMLYVHNVS